MCPSLDQQRLKRYFAQDVIAMANQAEGGQVFVGMYPGITADSDDHPGLPSIDFGKVQDRIAAIIRQHIEPTPVTEIQEIQLTSGQRLARVVVQGLQAEQPYHLNLRNASTPLTFIRRRTIDGTGYCTDTAELPERDALEALIQQKLRKRARQRRWQHTRFRLLFLGYIVLVTCFILFYTALFRSFAQFDDRVLTDKQAQRYRGTFTPDGRAIVFEESVDGLSSRLIQLDLQTLQRTTLVEGPRAGTWVAGPTYNTSGTLLAAAMGSGGPTYQRELFLFSADGRPLRQLTRIGCLVDHPAFVPNTSQIIFVSDCGENGFRIMRYDVSSNQLETVVAIDCRYPRSWGARLILLTCRDDAGIEQIKVYNEATQTLLPLVLGARSSAQAVPLVDGHSFIFVTERNWGSELALWQDGTIFAIAHDRMSTHPEVSPDRRRLLFMSRRTGSEQLYDAVVPDAPTNWIARLAQTIRVVLSYGEEERLW